MKKILLLSSAILLGVFFSSCGDKKTMTCVPSSADAVVVISLDEKLSDYVKPEALKEMLDEMGASRNYRDLITKFVEDPQSMGIDASKRISGWTELKNDMSPRMIGVAFPITKKRCAGILPEEHEQQKHLESLRHQLTRRIFVCLSIPT